MNSTGMVLLAIKPLSSNTVVNRRFKIKKQSTYEKALFCLLPRLILPTPPFSTYYEFGLSSKCADLDNCVKIFQDVLQKKYEFNDRHIYHMVLRKVDVKKGNEYIKFKIGSL